MFLNIFERFRTFSNTHFNTPAHLIENRAHPVPKFTHLRRKSALLIEIRTLWQRKSALLIEHFTQI